MSSTVVADSEARVDELHSIPEKMRPAFPLSVHLGTFCSGLVGHWVSLLVWRAVRKDAISSLPPVWVVCTFLGGTNNGLDGSGGDGGGKWWWGGGWGGGLGQGKDRV